MTKHEVMVSYVQDKIKELCDSILTFNFADGKATSVSFLTNYAGKIVKKYVRAADKEYGFTILLTWYYSEETDDINMQAMNLGQKFMEWIDKQNAIKNYPDFEGCQVKKIENLQNMPNLATVDWENKVAQYQIPCRVLYFEKERRR